MDKRLIVTLGCLAIFALATPAGAARVNADHPLASAPEQPGQSQGDWLILAGGDGGDGGNSVGSESPSEFAGAVRGDIEAAEEAVQNSALPTAKKAELMKMLDTGKSTVNNCEREYNRRAARRCFKEAVAILDDVMNIVEAEG